MRPDGPPSSNTSYNGIFYGWVIVAVMWLVNFSTMATGNLSFGLCVIPMGSTLGMNLSMFGWAVITRRLAAGLSGYIVGRLLDRYGPQVMIPVSQGSSSASPYSASAALMRPGKW